MTARLDAQVKSTSAPLSSTVPAKQKGNFLDYSLKKINPEDRDDGQCLTLGRRILLSQTIESWYFWSNIFSLIVLGCFLCWIIYQNRVHQRHELMNAEAFCQMQNALLRSEAHNNEATKRNHELMERLTIASDVGPSTSQIRAESAEPAPTKESVAAVTGIVAPAVLAKRGTAVSTQAHGITSPKQPNQVPQLGLFAPDVDQIAQVNALQQQLIRCQEKVKNLSRQLNDAENRLQEEQRRNRSLKGE